MNNIKFTTQLKSNKNEILNFFGKEFYFNFLSNTSKLGTWEIGSRADHFGAHIRVQKFHQLDDNKLFEDAKFYYITFNTLGLYKNKKEDDAYLSFSLREDLIKFWADKDTTVGDAIPDQNIALPWEEGDADAEERALLNDWLKQLPETEAKAIKLYFPKSEDEKKTLEEIGKELGMTKMGTKKVIDRAINKLKQFAKDANIG